MAQSVYFNGEILTIPGAYSTTDVSAMSTKGDATGAKILAIIGECVLVVSQEQFSSSVSPLQPAKC